MRENCVPTNLLVLRPQNNSVLIWELVQKRENEAILFCCCCDPVVSSCCLFEVSLTVIQAVHSVATVCAVCGATSWKDACNHTVINYFTVYLLPYAA
jgi:hypothetical protein